jgi:aminopeptidase N
MKTMRNLRFIFFFLLSFLSIPTWAEVPGVSHTLAKERAACVSQLSYELSFNIPEALDQKVTGRATLSFTLSSRQSDLLLDFCGNGLAKTLELNGKRLPTVWRDEHIALPHRHLKKGRNIVTLSFTSADKSLNRHADYLYTLFVPANARSVFPCFDQPDLKALFRVSLKVPEGWKTLSSDSTHLLPTYLFSFVAGKFQQQTVTRDGRQLTALYRETDPKKVAQLGKCFDEAALSLRWLEQFTGMACPFSHYGFVVLPGYQFGGMEHPSAIQFNDRRIFLGEHPTPDEELSRLELIAHETSHLWFGDMVTMRWFNDVWTKEVFANFMASKISREQFPDINHDLNFLKVYQMRALSTDRTSGTHPIQQPLDNLRDAGLLYGNIIYDKAPCVMRKLEQLMGPEAFRRGLQAYLHRFAYANATWDDLIALLDSVAPRSGVKHFSEVWVKQKGMPTIECTYEDEGVKVTQRDPYSRGLLWPQQFKVAATYRGALAELTDEVADTVETLPWERRPDFLIPNYDGEGYGRFLYTQRQADSLMAHFTQLPDLNRMAALMNLYENFLAHRISGQRYFHFIQSVMGNEHNALIASTMASQLATVKWYATPLQRPDIDRFQWAESQRHPIASLRLQLLRSLGTTATDPTVLSHVYEVWDRHADSTLTERDYSNMAYHLALANPQSYKEILARQRARLKTADEQREFDFVARACTPDTAEQSRLFYSLIPKEGRLVEPWARQMLSLLCDESREQQANSYLKPGLDALLSIQQSSDIFFPGYWLGALMGDHHSAEARRIVSQWIASHAGYPTSLMNKVKEQSYHLMNQQPLP